MTARPRDDLKVLMLHNDYQRVGGEHFSVRSEAAALREAGISVELLTVDNRTLSTRAPLSSLKQIVASNEAYELVQDAVGRVQPTIVHAQNMFPTLGPGAIRAIRETGVPWVRSLRNYRLRCISGNCFLGGQTCTRCTAASTGLPGIAHACYRGSRIASAAAVGYARSEVRSTASYPPDAYVLLSESMRDLLAGQIERSQVYVKPNPIERIADAPLARTERDRTVLFVGRLSEEKNPALVFDLAEREPGWQFRVIGEGPLLSSMRDRAERYPNVHLLGVQDHETTLDAMRRATLVIAPSTWEEPFGRTAAESCGAGTPVVVSSRGGLRDIIAPVDPLLVARDDSPDSWHAATTRVTRLAPAQYDNLAAELHARWQSTFSPSVVTNRMLEIYDAVLTSTDRNGRSAA